LEKPTPPGTFAGGTAPRGIVAWAVLPIVLRGGGGVVSGEVSADSMYRVKEAYTEATVLEAAAASTHTLKSHKPIRCRVAIHVSPLHPTTTPPTNHTPQTQQTPQTHDQARRAEAGGEGGAPVLRNFSASGGRSRWWWEAMEDDAARAAAAAGAPEAAVGATGAAGGAVGGGGAAVRGGGGGISAGVVGAGAGAGAGLDVDNNLLSGVSRDLFMYVDTVAFGRRKDTRIKVQLREDDLDIDAPGVPAMVAAAAGGAAGSSAGGGGGFGGGGFNGGGGFHNGGGTHNSHLNGGQAGGQGGHGGLNGGLNGSGLMNGGAGGGAGAGVGGAPRAMFDASFGSFGSNAGGGGPGGGATAGGLERTAWTPLSVGRSKGGAWCHEVGPAAQVESS
jgi:hypothetical protein